ncbi:MAG: hypothetical protein U0800_01395 [Isosphaeraceae bacterium]
MLHVPQPAPHLARPLEKARGLGFTGLAHSGIKVGFAVASGICPSA